MSLTLVEVIERLKRLDEITLLEVLEISTEDLLDRFIDKVEERFDELEEDLSDHHSGS